MIIETTRRTFLAAAGAVALGAACSSEEGAPTENAASRKEEPAAARPRTFVLMHGAWHGGWCWSRVADPLRAAGHRVYTPTQTGLGERSHLLSRDITLDTFVADLINVLEWEDLNDAVLVGHSFGGIAISGAADRVPHRIRHLVYLDAIVPRDGMSFFGALPPDVMAARRKVAQDTSGGLSMPVPDVAAFGVTDPADVAWLTAKCTPHPISTFESSMTLKNPVGNGLPATYVAVTPEFAPTASSRALAKEQAGWRYVEIAAGHDAMVTSPGAFVDLLLDL